MKQPQYFLFCIPLIVCHDNKRMPRALKEYFLIHYSRFLFPLRAHFHSRSTPSSEELVGTELMPSPSRHALHTTQTPVTLARDCCALLPSPPPRCSRRTTRSSLTSTSSAFGMGAGPLRARHAPLHTAPINLHVTFSS